MTGLAVQSPTLEQILRLQEHVKTLPPVECPVTDHWADGIYGRETFIPAGSVVVGRMHRDATLNVLVQGEIAVTGPDGSVELMRAPAIFTSPAMTKKVGLAVTDVIWLNVHPTKLRDVASIENKFMVPETPAIEGEG